MELRSVSGNINNTPLSMGNVRHQKPGSTLGSIKDEIVKAQNTRSELKEKIGLLEESKVAYGKSRDTNKLAYKITKVASLAGLAAFVAGTLMATGPLFVAGAALGGTTYVASGWFKGRTQWFTEQTGKAGAEAKKLNIKAKAVDKEINKLTEKHDKIAVVEKMANQLKAEKPEAIQDQGDFVSIGGVKLKKARSGAGRILDDLFSPLEK